MAPTNVYRRRRRHTSGQFTVPSTPQPLCTHDTLTNPTHLLHTLPPHVTPNRPPYLPLIHPVPTPHRPPSDTPPTPHQNPNPNPNLITNPHPHPHSPPSSYRVCPKVTNTFPILPPLSTRFGPPFIAIVTVFRSVYMKRKPRMPFLRLLRMVALSNTQ